MKRTINFALAVGLSLFFAGITVTAQTAPTNTSSTDCAELPALKTRLDLAESRLKDWQQLGRYRESNQNLPPAFANPPKGVSRVVFMGDSITDAWGNNPQYRATFPGASAERGIVSVDRGISGQTTPQMLVRFRPDVINLQPKVVVILAGTNDIAGNTGPMTLADIENNLMSMAELARTNNIRVVLASVLPVSDYGKDREGKPITQTVRRPPAQINELNAWIKQYAARNNHVYLNYFPALVDDKGFLKAELSGDGLHPNEKGYQVMAPLAEAAIKEALKK